MRVLEKILEEIEAARQEPLFRLCDYSYKDRQERIISRIEDIIRSHMDDDGWIPCEERIPDKDGFYLATLDGEIVGQDQPFAGLAEFENGKWVDDEEDYQCILAWKPLPKPYMKEV